MAKAVFIFYTSLYSNIFKCLQLISYAHQVFTIIIIHLYLL
jgi:hypothetical protein